MNNDIWATLGSVTGQGISRSLQRSAQQKMAEHERKQQIGTLNQFFPESVSGLILSLPEKDRWPAIQALAPEFANEQGGQNQSGLEALVAQSQLGPQGPQPLDQLLAQGMGARTQQGQPLSQQIQQPVDQNEINLRSNQTPISEKQRFANAFNKPNTKEALAEQKEINKIQKGTVEKINKDKAFSDFARPKFAKLKDYVKRGNLPVSSIYNILKKAESGDISADSKATGIAGAALGAKIAGPAGLVAGGIAGAVAPTVIKPMATILRHIQKGLSPDTEAYEKEIATFLTGIKNVIGGNLTNQELEAYMDMFPDLTKTDAGKLAIIESAELFMKASDVRWKAKNKIIRSNNGKIPFDLDEQIDRYAQPELEKISNIFRSDVLAAGGYKS